MSDILIAQEVGTVVVIETAPAEIVEWWLLARKARWVMSIRKCR